MIGDVIQKRGHELIIVEEKNVYEDYEIDYSQDSWSEEVDEEEAQQKGLVKRRFPGVLKLPQLISRCSGSIGADPMEVFKRTAQKFGQMMIGELEDNYDKCEEEILKLKPDLIILDTFFLPPCVLKNKSVPWVKLFSANPIRFPKSKLPGGELPPATCGFKLYTKEERERMRAEEPEKWESIISTWRVAREQIEEGMSKFSAPIGEFMRRHGVEPPPPGSMGHDSEFLNLYLYPKELDYDQEDDLFEYPKMYFRCDSLMQAPTKNDEQLEYWSEKLNAAMKGKEAMVYFSLGSIASGNVNLMQRYLNILRKDTKRLYVISKGVNGDKFELDSSNMIGGNYIPQTFFLERANLAIVHGGNNSITECMYYGVPAIVLPIFADQSDNAQRVEDLGLGKRLSIRDCTEQELKSAIDEILLDDRMIEKVKSIGRNMRSRDETKKVSIILKKLLEDGHLEPEFVEQWRYKEIKVEQ